MTDVTRELVDAIGDTRREVARASHDARAARAAPYFTLPFRRLLAA